jgi:drug/metabolite transporter (DMT)-like permease
MLDIIALHAIFGTSIPIGKKLLTFVPPIFLTGIRMTIAGFLLMIFNIFWQKKSIALRLKFWPYYAQIIIIGVYLRYILRYWGLQHMPAIKMGFLVNSTPFIAALFSYLFFHERLTKKKWLGLGLGVSGYIPILLTRSIGEQKLGDLWVVSWPELAIFTAVVAYCYSMTISRRLLREHNHSASLTNGIRMVGGGSLALITAFFIEPVSITNVPEFIGWLALLIMISDLICHNYLIYLLKYYSMTFVSFTDFLSPLFTGLYSWYFLNEAITWHYGVGSLVIIAGLYLFYQDELSTVGVIKQSAVTA